MSVERVVRKNGEVVWRVRWREGGHNRSKVLGRKRDADAFDAKVREHKRVGDLAALDGGRETLTDYVEGTWAVAHAAHLAPKTRQLYAYLWHAHLERQLGALALRELNPDVIARWQADRLAAGAGPHAVHKALKLLGAILQRAAESRRISGNPARLVRKAPLALAVEVRPLAPASVEALRAAMLDRASSPEWRHWDATLISVLAYAGLRPQEARALRWAHVRERTLIASADKTRSRRTVRLLAPLRADLAEWRLAQGRPGDREPVFCAAGGGPWTANAYALWRARRFACALTAAGLEPTVPYALRHSFASLLLHEGRSVIYVARQLGHGAQLTSGTYGHVIDELEDQPRLAAEEAIRMARAERAGTRLVPAGPAGGM